MFSNEESKNEASYRLPSGVELSSANNTVRNTNEYRNIGSSGLMSSNHIASENFTGGERLIFAITDDDVATFEQLKVPLDELAFLRFDTDLNILNFAIDQDRPNIVKHLAAITADDPALQKELTSHKFGNCLVQAVHQAVTLGSKVIFECIVNDFKADLNVKTHNELSVMHCAAQHY